MYEGKVQQNQLPQVFLIIIETLDLAGLAGGIPND